MLNKRPHNAVRRFMIETDDNQKLSEILRDIEAVKQENDQRIGRINTTKVVTMFQYVVSQSMVENCFKFDVVEGQVQQNTTEITKAWRSSNQMIVVPDIFNDKLNYSYQTYDDLVRLNREMYAVAQKYELFGDSEKARQEASKFLKNFQLIKTSLEQLEETMNNEVSKLEELKNTLNDINSQLENLKKENTNLSFAASTTVPKSQVSCYQCGQTPQTMSYYRNDAEPLRNDKFRVNGYSALCVGHTNTAAGKWIFVGTY